MVKIFKLKKYNPCYYIGPVYSKSEWTDISDIGLSFDDGVLKKEEYLRVELNYIRCFDYIMDQCGIVSLQILRAGPDIEDFPGYQEYLFGMDVGGIVNFQDKSFVERTEIRNFLRLMLRGLSGYGVTNNKDFFIWGTGELYFRIGIPDRNYIDPKVIQDFSLYLEYVGKFSPDNELHHDYAELFGMK